MLVAFAPDVPGRTLAIAVILCIGAVASVAIAEPQHHPIVIAPVRDARPVHLAPLMAEAVRQHPALREARLSAAAAREVPSQAGSLPDPVFGVALQNLRTDDPGLDGSPMSALQLSLTQGFPFPGKLGDRRALAEAMAVVADQRLAVEQNDVVLAVRRAYWKLQYAEAAERITTESERVLDTLANAVHARLSVGQGALQDSAQTEVEHSRLRAMLQQRRQMVRSARRALNGAVGRTPDDNISAADSPPKGRVRVDRVALLRDVRRNNPGIGLRKAQVTMARSAVDESKQDRWPDFEVGVQYRFRQAAPGDMSQGADMFGVSLGVRLPIWAGNKQNARVRQSYHQLGAAHAGVGDARLAAATRAEKLADAVDRLNDEIELYQQELLPEASQAVDASIDDYEVGRVELASILMNWETDLQSRLAFAALLAERVIALAEIDAVAGRKP